MQPHDDFIGVFDAMLGKSYCENVIQMFNEREQAGFTYLRDSNRFKKSQADDTSLFFSSCPAEHLSDNLYSSIHNALWSAYMEYVKNYEIALTEQTGPHHVYEYKIQKTKPGQGYHSWHYESPERTSCQRLLAYTIYLNDIQEGGETEFLYQKRRVCPQQGRIAIWPAGFTHLHRGNPPLSNDKYIVTGWFEL